MASKITVLVMGREGKGYHFPSLLVQQSTTLKQAVQEIDDWMLARQDRRSTSQWLAVYLESWLARKLSPVVVDAAVVVQNVDELQVVALAHHEIVGVVGGGDLHSTWGQGGGGE